MIKTLTKQKRPYSKSQLAEYRFGVLEDGLHVLECQNQELTNEISNLKDLIETLIEKIED